MADFIHHHTSHILRKHNGIGNGSTPATTEEVDAVVIELKLSSV